MTTTPLSQPFTASTEAARYAPRPVQVTLWIMAYAVGVVLLVTLALRLDADPVVGFCLTAAAVLTLGVAADHIAEERAWRREQRRADEERRTLSDRRRVRLEREAA